MSVEWWGLLSALTAVGAATTGGVLFGFSAFIMRGLDSTSAPAAVAAMNEINRAAVRAPFMIPMFGTALLCIVLGIDAVSGLGEGDGSGAWLALTGGGFYLASLVITMVYHVPRNDALLTVAPGDPKVSAAWTAYVRGWVRWNHARTAAALVGALCFTLGVM